MLDYERLVAPNPGPMTLEGTNTYLVDRDPCWVIDPGPDDAGHIARVRAAAEARGGIAGVLLTHAHADHSAGLGSLDAPVAVDPPFQSIPTPGHAPDHLCFVRERTCLCGDLILGRGSSIVPPAEHGGSLADYLDSLDRLAGLDLELLLPGHGDPIADPAAKISEYAAHRRERERLLVGALGAGERDRERLLDAGWSDVPAAMRPAAHAAMQAHLEKLGDEGRLPPGFVV